MFRKVTIVGVGLMGGSLGMAIKKYSLAQEIVGYSHRQSSLMEAIKAKAIDTAETDAQKALHHADLVIFATPVDTIMKLLPMLAPHIRKGCYVTDIGSVKADIVEAAEKYLQTPMFFVGSHPLVGSEKQGVENAKAELFEGTLCLITPTEKTNPAVKEKMKQFWTKVGAKVSILSPTEHDEILSYTSHLPHVIAYSLVDVLPQKCQEFTAQGFKDTTRIASSSAQIWTDICMANSKNIIQGLDLLVKNLAEIRKVIYSGDQNTLTQIFTRAKEKRDAIISSNGHHAEKQSIDHRN